MKLYILLAYITAALASCQNTSPFDFGLEAIYADSDTPCHGRTSVPVHAVEIFAVPHISWSILTTAQTSEELFVSQQQAVDGGFSPIAQGMQFTSGRLSNGGLHPIADGMPYLHSNSLAVVPGDSPSFITMQYPPPSPDAYCLVAGEQGTLLAVNGMTDQWALCPNITAGYRMDVVLRPRAGNPHYILEKCSKVYLSVTAAR